MDYGLWTFFPLFMNHSLLRRSVFFSMILFCCAVLIVLLAKYDTYIFKIIIFTMVIKLKFEDIKS